MINWNFNTSKENIWLGTSINPRAEAFYRKAGWKEIGVHGKGEIEFQRTIDDWEYLIGAHNS